MSGPATGLSDDELDVRLRATLERIARLIGRPVESLIHGLPPEEELGGAVELIQLWHAIRRTEDRERLLALARELTVN